MEILAPLKKYRCEKIKNVTFFTVCKNTYFWGNFFKLFQIYRSAINSDQILVNNRKAACLMLIFYIFLLRKKITYDMREFYELNFTLGIKNYIGTCIEMFFIKNCVDVIICANEQRQRLLKSKIKKNIDFIVIENVRKLPTSTTKNILDVEIGGKKFEKLKSLSSSNIINIVSTDGISYQRETSKIINACYNLNTKVHFHILGRVSKDSETLLSDIRAFENVTFYGPVSHDALGQILQFMDAGIVRYNLKDRNNRYCASGKLYEFIYAGLPVICSANPPLKKFISETETGVASACFDGGVTQLISNLEYFRENVQRFISLNRIDDVENEKLQLLEEVWKV